MRFRSGKEFIHKINYRRVATVLMLFLVIYLAEIAVIRTVKADKEDAVPTITSENWGLGFGKEGQPPTAAVSATELKKYDAYYINETQDKVIYLTFDAGFEAGYTPQILEALKKHNVKATFFVVGNYLETRPDLVKQMVEEGHTVGNHTYHHPDMSKISTLESFQSEMEQVEQLYQSITGQSMKKFYRPPQGKYSKENFLAERL